ncbi:MAG: outer membrane lipoprotein carrier protein LolA [Candidatus Eisenbacteria bacterium]|nr:outer membrane lipoprotein carrier protein LolA [Candidatus Eisenbacteria bacterium]
MMISCVRLHRPGSPPPGNVGLRVALVAAVLACALADRVGAAVLPEARPLLSKLESALAPLHDFQAGFVQVRHIDLTDENIEARGRLKFLAPDSFRLDYLEPDADVLAMQGDSMLVYFPSMNQAQRHLVDRQDATRNIFLLFASRKGELGSRFDISLAPPGPGGPALRLQPLAGTLDYPIQEIVVRPHSKSGLPEELYFREEGGDTVVFRLSSIKTNRNITRADFVFVPPAGTEILDR